MSTMDTDKKKILIIDEAGFSRICSAILEKEGYRTCTICDARKVEPTRNFDDFGLIITSYPFGAPFLDELKKSCVPTIVLSDRLNKDLMATLETMNKSLLHCMIKPLDYTKFRALVGQVMGRDASSAGQALLASEFQTNVPAGMQTEP